jgi:hypothetical protein
MIITEPRIEAAGNATTQGLYLRVKFGNALVAFLGLLLTVLPV